MEVKQSCDIIAFTFQPNLSIDGPHPIRFSAHTNSFNGKEERFTDEILALGESLYDRLPASETRYPLIGRKLEILLQTPVASDFVSVPARDCTFYLLLKLPAGQGSKLLQSEMKKVKGT